MILDYMFGVKESELKNGLTKSRKAKSDLERNTLEIYDKIFSVLSSTFDINTAEIKELADAMPTKGPKDTILYVTK